MTDVAAAPARANRSKRAVLSAQGANGLSAESLSVLATLPLWWERRCQAAGISAAEIPDLEGCLAAGPPFNLGLLDEVPSRDDLLDGVAERLADAYVIGLEDAVRSADGRHYTPASLAEILFTQAVSVLGREPDGLVWDPACGAGALLLPALRSWLRQQVGTDPAEVIAAVDLAVGGRDLDGAAVYLGNVLLAAELLPTWAKIPARLRPALPVLLTVGDGLGTPPHAPQIAVLNPPYGRVRLVGEDRKRWDHVLFGHANRYGLFMAACAEFLAPGGVMSALVPAGWLGGSYFQRLRGYLAGVAPLRQVTYVSGRSGVFSTGVLQETVLATFQHGESHGSVLCARVTADGSTTRQIGEGKLPKPGDRPWLLPREPADIPLVEAARQMPHRLADYGWSVSTGPLVWNRHKPQLSAESSLNSVKIVWAADLDGGELHQDPSRDSLRHLALRDRDEKVLVLDRPAVLVQRTTAPEQPRRLLAAALDEAALARWGGRISVENHVNVLTPQPQPDLTASQVLSPTILTALLDSDALDRLYRCLTGSVAVSAYELSALPLPPPEMIQQWAELPADQLQQAINLGYGLAP